MPMTMKLKIRLTFTSNCVCLCFEIFGAETRYAKPRDAVDQPIFAFLHLFSPEEEGETFEVLGLHDLDS
jgi:hypothetical protein